jgi:hypothetical protein
LLRQPPHGPRCRRWGWGCRVEGLAGRQPPHGPRWARQGLLLLPLLLLLLLSWLVELLLLLLLTASCTAGLHCGQLLVD